MKRILPYLLACVVGLASLSVTAGNNAVGGDEILASDITLSQNYPNPAKNITKINVSFSDEYGVLTVYNVLGKQIEKILVRDRTIFLDVSKYPDGVYLYTFEADGEKITKRMTVKKN